MHKKTKFKLALVTFCLIVTGLGVYIILHNLEQNIVFFYPPSKLHQADVSREMRVGGLVKAGSIVRIAPGKIKFIITDNVKELEIHYSGVLPALFREGQGIVAQGKLQQSIFIAKELLAKHDENYKPPST